MSDVGPAPPAVGVNVKVTETPALPQTRSAAAIVKNIPPTAPPIKPDETDTEPVVSVLVCTVTDVFPAVGAPMVRPESVTVTAVLAASAVPPVIMTMDVALGALGTRVVPFVDREPFGVVVDTKKPEG